MVQRQCRSCVGCEQRSEPVSRTREHGRRLPLLHWGQDSVSVGTRQLCQSLYFSVSLSVYTTLAASAA